MSERAKRKSVALRTAARELALEPRELELAVRLEKVRTVAAPQPAPRRVPHSEVERLRAAEGFPERLRERLRLVGAAEGARLLDISAARFGRLAKAGYLSPVTFYVRALTEHAAMTRVPPSRPASRKSTLDRSRMEKRNGFRRP